MEVFSIVLAQHLHQEDHVHLQVSCVCVFVRVCLCICMCTRVCGGGTHMCMGRSVCVWAGGRGYTHMCMDVCAACVCLWDGVGVHTRVYMCVRNTACVYVFVEHRVYS